MAEWLYEEGIGEARAALSDKGRLGESQIERESDAARTGAVVQGTLVRTVLPKEPCIACLRPRQTVRVAPLPPKLPEGPRGEAPIERESDAARPGEVVHGKLDRTVIPKKRGIARLIAGEEVLVEPIPPKIAEGATVLLEILREAIPEEGRAKLAKARIAQPGSKAHPAPSLLQRLRATGLPVIPCPAHEEDRFEAHGWSE